jgi:hypothetical protein
MFFDRVLCDKKLLGDRLIAQPFGKSIKDFFLSFGQFFERIVIFFMDYAVDRFRIIVASAVVNQTHCSNKFFGQCFFQDIAIHYFLPPPVKHRYRKRKR